MTRGVLIIAFDTAQIKYTRIAEVCARRVKKHLKLPVALITGSDISPNTLFDKIITIDVPPTRNRANHLDGRIWINWGRWLCYDLSPWDETLLIDADYMVGDNTLLSLFNMNKPLLCHNTRSYIGTHANDSGIERWGYNYHMWWATVLYWKRNDVSQALFTIWKMVAENWSYYGSLYRFTNTHFRNDWALSIAMGIIGGHTQPDEFAIPWKLIHSEPGVDVTFQEDRWECQWNQNSRMHKIRGSGDLHILDKDSCVRMCDE